MIETDRRQAMRPPAMRIADDPALDFLNTIGAPRGEMIEWLGNGQDLVDWLLESGLIMPDQLAGLGPSAAQDAAAAEARSLREEFRAFLTDGRSDIFDRLNTIFEREHSCWQLQPGEPPQLTRVQQFDRPDQLLLPIAAAIAQLIARDEGTRVRLCDGPTCTMWFRDISRNNRRRWCSMAVCGNRAKAAAHRAKAKGETGA